MILKPNQRIKIDAIEMSGGEYAKWLIDQLHEIGVASKSDYKKHVKKFDRWLMGYGLKFQEKSDETNL